MLVKRIGEHDLPPPAKTTEGAAGFDLQAVHDEIVGPGQWRIIKTGFAWQIPAGFVGMVCSRSGLALKHGVTVLNAPGIIDPDYVGEVCVILHNVGALPFKVQRGDRIAQLLIAPAPGGCCTIEVAELPETKRGAAGFGSTGLAQGAAAAQAVSAATSSRAGDCGCGCGGKGC